MIIELSNYNVNRIKKSLEKGLEFDIPPELGFYSGFVEGVLNLYFKEIEKREEKKNKK